MFIRGALKSSHFVRPVAKFIPEKVDERTNNNEENKKEVKVLFL